MPNRLEAVPDRVGRRVPACGEAPGRQGQAIPGRHRASPGPQSGRLPRDLAGLRVLIVDDDESTLEIFAAALSTCGATVTTALAATAALRLVTETRPDVILSDIAMPDEDGYWLVREIRRLPDETIRRLPVLAATAYGREHPRERTLAAGFMDHLQKPIDPEVLCRAVARAAGR
jgi:CheY-like chemotaxis protein